MKILLRLSMCIFLLFWGTLTFAEETKENIGLKCPEGLKWISGGCYETLDNALGRRMIIDTWKPMMQSKYAVWMFRNRESKEALEVTKVLHQKLMNIPAVNGVQIEDRRIIVSVYRLDKIPIKAIEEACGVLLK